MAHSNDQAGWPARREKRLPGATAAAAELESLPGLGPRSAALLAAVGVHSIEGLRRLGAARCFVRVEAAGLRPSLNLLWALDGALTGRPWLDVARTERTRLLLEVDDLRRHASGATSPCTIDDTQRKPRLRPRDDRTPTPRKSTAGR